MEALRIENAQLKTELMKVTGLKVKAKKKGKTYYFKVRAYKNIGGKDIYTGYSKVVKIKAK